VAALENGSIVHFWRGQSLSLILVILVGILDAVVVTTGCGRSELQTQEWQLPSMEGHQQS
jgi:hypothetical protein